MITNWSAVCYSGDAEGLVATLVTVGEGWLQGGDATGIIAPHRSAAIQEP